MGGQSSFTRSRLNLNWKILGAGQSDRGVNHLSHMSRLNLNWKILGAGQSDGGQSSFTMSRLNLNWKILGAGQSDRGVNHLSHMSRLNLKWKILGEILVSQTGGSIIFHHVQAKSELKNFRWDPGWSDEGFPVHRPTYTILTLYKSCSARLHATKITTNCNF